MASLSKKAASGVAWSALERFGQQGCSFLVQLVLARLLAPEQFGLIAMVAVFIALCQGIADAGLHEAIIQKKYLSDSLVSTVFYTNLLLACFLTGALWLAAPMVENFYAQADLALLLKVLSLALLIDGFARIQLTLLQKRLLFRKLATATLSATILSGAVAVVLAFQGLGVWALIVQVLLQRCIIAIMFWWRADWRPQLVYSLQALREVLPFASRMFASNILNNFFQQVYVLFIGRVGSPVDLGYYQRADSFKRLASSASNTLMARITFPLFAQVHDDPPRLRRGFMKACQLLAFVFFPLMAMLAAVGEPLIMTLIGEKWLPTVPFLYLLCLVGALHPFHAINLSLIKALGHGRLFLRLEIIKKFLIVIVLFITYRYGIFAIVIGQAFCSLAALWLNAYYTRKLIDVSYRQQFRTVSGSVTISLLLAYLTANWLLPVLAIAPLIKLLLGLMFSFTIWVTLVFLGRHYFEFEINWFAAEFSRLQLLKRKST